MQHQVSSIATMCFTELGLPTTMNVLQSKELYSSVDELSPKVRKPYTITKQRERWTEDEHKKFLESLKLYGRAWRKIEEHIGTKTVVQIRSHAQKFFTKVALETANNGADSPNSIEIPPPRPKKKPMHPYPRKLENICEKGVIVSGQDKSPHLLDMSPRMGSSDMISSIIEEENGSPSSAFSVTGRDLLELNQVNHEAHVSHAAGSSTHDGFDPENGFSSPSLSTDLNLVESFIPPLHDKGFSSPDLMSKITSLDQPSTFSNVDSSTSNSKEETCCEETTDSVSAIKDPSTEPSSMSLKLFGQTFLVNPSSAVTINRHKSPFSTIEDDSLENFTGNEIIQGEKEVDCNIESNNPREIESSDEVSKGSSQEAAWNLCPANPQMVYCLQYQQGDSYSELDYVSVAPWMALYGKFLFPFVQSMSPHDPDNAQSRHGFALDDPFDSAMYAMNNKKNESSDSSEPASVTNNSTVEKVISAGQEGDDLQSIGLFSRKVSFRSTGTGFVPYKRCVAESNGENPRQFDRTGEEKRIRLCL